MRALTKHAPGEGNVSIAEMPEPSCAEGRVKIEVRFCGIAAQTFTYFTTLFPTTRP